MSRKQMQSKSMLALSLALCVVTSTAYAAACTTHKWVSVSPTGAWLDDANWDPVGPIAADDKVKFDTSATPAFPSSGAITVGQIDIIGAGTTVALLRSNDAGGLNLGDVNIISSGSKLLLAANGDQSNPGIVINSLSGAGDLEVQSVYSVVPYIQFNGVVELTGKLITLCNGGSATFLQFQNGGPANPTWKFGGLHFSTATQDGHCHTVISSAVNLKVTEAANIQLFAHLWADSSAVTFDKGVSLYAAGAEVRASSIVSAGVCNFAFNGASWLIALGAGGVTCNGVTGVTSADINIISAAPDRGPVVLGSVTGGDGGASVWLQGGNGASSADINLAAGATLSVGTFRGTFTVDGTLTTGPLFVHIYNPPVDGVVSFTNPALSVGAVQIGAVSTFAGSLAAASIAGAAVTSLTVAGDLTVACGGALFVPGPALHVAGNIDAGTCPPPPSPMVAALPTATAAPVSAAPAAAPVAAPVAAAPSAAPRLAKLFGRSAAVVAAVKVPVPQDSAVSKTPAAKHSAAEVAALVTAQQKAAKAKAK